MRTSTYIRAAAAASECSTVLFDEAQLEEGEEKSLGILHRAVRKRDQFTKFSEKAVSLADRQDEAIRCMAKQLRRYGDALDAMTKEYVA